MAGGKKYTDSDIARMRETSIAEVLRQLGHDTRHTRHGLYFSPFRQEKTPSFHIDDNVHGWFDYGPEVPGVRNCGDVFHLLERLNGWSFNRCCEFLSAFHPDIVPHDDEIIDAPAGAKVRSWKRTVTGCDKEFSGELRAYARDVRRIPEDILMRYCWNVRYTMTSDDGRSYEHAAIGFPNVKGQWALRWPSLVKGQGKVSTGQGYTAITSGGDFLSEADIASGALENSGTVMVFEGFFDYLSYLAWNHRDTPRAGEAVILNTVKNVRAAAPYLAGFGKVIGFLDNDAAGDECTQVLRKGAEERGAVFEDRRDRFRRYGSDVNEAWTVRMLEHEERQREELARQKAAQEAERRSAGEAAVQTPEHHVHR